MISHRNSKRMSSSGHARTQRERGLRLEAAPVDATTIGDFISMSVEHIMQVRSNTNEHHGSKFMGIACRKCNNKQMN